MAKSQHSLYFGTRARLFKITNIQDPMLKRMLTKLQNLEKAALPQEELQEVMDGAPRSPGTWSLPPRVEWAVQVGSQGAWAGGRLGRWQGRPSMGPAGKQRLVGIQILVSNPPSWLGLDVGWTHPG